ncbi:MAG: hypothetical protein Q7T66_04815 [Herminiimonas sp.]|uniref:hypothetical protein n=1 Tax=Herminiimonas sp. TaxID=1926289 RepID=UPI0027211538|nr:hypothetical protein [Herminiimonas sp.]MDO9419967.1 hypothetical protein [Herminiimonas sp.]
MSECTLQVIGALKDISLAVAGIVTACVAIAGLKNWNRELKGKAQFEVARNLIRATYDLRDKLNMARSPAIFSNEYPSEYSHFDQDPKVQASAEEFVYQARMKPVLSSLREYQTSALEAEALWGKDIKEKCTAFESCIGMFRNAVSSYIKNTASRGEYFNGREALQKTTEERLWDSLDESNEFTKEINRKISDLENLTRPHLAK